MNTRNWKLERYLLGELDPEEMERIRAELEADGALRDRLEALKNSDTEIRERYPAEWMSRRIRNSISGVEALRARPEKHRPTGFLIRPFVPVGLLGLLLLLIVIWPDAGDREHLQPAMVERIKGLDPALQFYRRTAAGSERLPDGAVVREHDVIMIRYQPAGRAFGAILSVDGRGTVTLHFPTEGPRAAALPREGVVPLEFAYELDDAPYGERFYFITSNKPFDLEPIVRAARRGSSGPAIGTLPALPDSLVIGPGLNQYIHTLRKEAGHE